MTDKSHTDDDQVFVLTREQVTAAFTVQLQAYRINGYHTWDYWRNTPDGLAVLGEMFLDLLSEANYDLLGDIYNNEVRR